MAKQYTLTYSRPAHRNFMGGSTNATPLNEVTVEIPDEEVLKGIVAGFVLGQWLTKPTLKVRGIRDLEGFVKDNLVGYVKDPDRGYELYRKKDKWDDFLNDLWMFSDDMPDPNDRLLYKDVVTKPYTALLIPDDDGDYYTVLQFDSMEFLQGLATALNWLDLSPIIHIKHVHDGLDRLKVNF